MALMMDSEDQNSEMTLEVVGGKDYRNIIMGDFNV